MTGQGGADGAPAVQERSTESGKSRLLVSEILAAPSAAAAALPPPPASTFPSPAALFHVTSAFTGESLARQLRRTVVPLPPEFLSGVDAQGQTVEPDVEEVERRMSLYSLLIEYSFCPQYAPEGVYCMPSWNDLRVWHGVIFIRHGIYRGGVFKFKIIISEDYPRQAPVLQFLSRVYHVLVDPDTAVLNLHAETEMYACGLHKSVPDIQLVGRKALNRFVDIGARADALTLLLSSYAHAILVAILMQMLFPQWQIDDYLAMLLMYLKSIFFRQEFLQGTADRTQWENVEAAKAYAFLMLFQRQHYASIRLRTILKGLQ